VAKGAAKGVAEGTAKGVADSIVEGAAEGMAEQGSTAGREEEEACTGGTPGYAAPEILENGGAFSGVAASPKVDVWASGVLLYEALSGETPFGSYTCEFLLPRLYKKICHGAVDLSSPRWEAVPAPAKALIRACLERDPSRRVDARGVLAHEFVGGLPWVREVAAAATPDACATIATADTSADTAVAVVGDVTAPRRRSEEPGSSSGDGESNGGESGAGARRDGSPGIGTLPSLPPIAASPSPAAAPSTAVPSLERLVPSLEALAAQETSTPRQLIRPSSFGAAGGGTSTPQRPLTAPSPVRTPLMPVRSAARANSGLGGAALLGLSQPAPLPPIGSPQQPRRCGKALAAGPGQGAPLASAPPEGE
jgi:hypothetical protein